jgi:hypothetical protein
MLTEVLIYVELKVVVELAISLMPGQKIGPG